MISYNHIVVTGNCGRDPELNVTGDGTPFARFSVALNERSGKDASGKPQYVTTWLNVVAWRQLAENVNTYVHKGSPVLVAGRLVVRKFDDKTGVERTSVEIIASEVNSLAKQPASAPAGDDLLGEEFP